MLKLIEGFYLGKAEPESGGGGSAPVIEELNVTPTTSAQVITAPSGTDGYNPVNVSAVTSSIDANITSANIIDGITILGVTGSATELNGTTLNVTPTTVAQTITPTSPNNGFTEVDVDAVTSSIDENIQAENIKNGVSILGVTGNVNALVGQTKSVSQNGVVTPDVGYNGLTSVSVNVPSKLVKANYVIDGNGTVSNIKKGQNTLSGNETTINNGNFKLAYYNNSTIAKADLSAITDIENEAYNMFFGCTALKSIDMCSLQRINYNSAVSNFCSYNSILEEINLSLLSSVNGDEACYFMAASCTNLTSANLQSLSTINGLNACTSMFYSAGITSVDLSSLTTVSGESACESMFYGCPIVNVNFISLSSLNGSFAFKNIFEGCTSLTDVYFNALTTTSFGSYTNQFFNMLGSTGTNVTHTLHFPSNMQNTISGLMGYPNFGGSSDYVVLAFDLPATS